MLQWIVGAEREGWIEIAHDGVQWQDVLTESYIRHSQAI